MVGLDGKWRGLKKKKNDFHVAATFFVPRYKFEMVHTFRKGNISDVSILVHFTCINIQTHELQKARADKFLDRLLNLKLFDMYLLHNLNEGVKNNLVKM